MDAELKVWPGKDNGGVSHQAGLEINSSGQSTANRLGQPLFLPQEGRRIVCPACVEITVRL
jgi:hypothetical protein